MLKRTAMIFLLLSVTCFFSCDFEKSGSSEKDQKSRPFLMGFTPWPYDATIEAVDWSYEKINENGDIISHHMEEGVPWQESFSGSDFPAELISEIESRTIRYIDGKKVLLSVSPLNMARDGMALNRGSSESMPLPAPWNTYALNSIEVKTSFLNYSKRMIEYFDPDFLIIGVEVNLLIRNTPSLWQQYLELHRYVYTELKKFYPSLQIGVSVVCTAYFPEWSSEDNIDDQLSGLEDLDSSIDFLAFSVHPFMSALTAESFPDDYMQRLFALTDKPVAISESSYPAQSWQTINAPIIDFNGTPEKQKNFVSLMLEQSAESNALFVIWFSIRDFDALWNGLLNQDALSLIWRDTGLYDEQGDGRLALDTWTDWFDMGVSE